jgi:hypothetical protein
MQIIDRAVRKRHDEEQRQRRALQEVSMLEKQKRRDEDLHKWKDTGLEEEAAKVYQNPSERRRAAAAAATRQQLLTQP